MRPIIILLLLCSPALAQPKFEDQPSGIRRLFEKQAPNWVKIGDKLWSVEVMHQAKKRAKSKRGKAYQDESAPWFYEPIEGTRCRRIGDVYKHMKLEPPEGYELLEGKTVGPIKEGFWLRYPKDKTFFIHCTNDQPPNQIDIVVIGKKSETRFHYNGTGWHTLHLMPTAQAYEAITAHNLFDYHVSHQIKTLPAWRGIPDRKRNIFQWKNFPRKLVFKN